MKHLHWFVLGIFITLVLAVAQAAALPALRTVILGRHSAGTRPPQILLLQDKSR